MATHSTPAWLLDDTVERQTASEASEPTGSVSHHFRYSTAADEGHGGTGQAAMQFL
jgi:hypothetical protein